MILLEAFGVSGPLILQAWIVQIYLAKYRKAAVPAVTARRGHQPDDRYAGPANRNSGAFRYTRTIHFSEAFKATHPARPEDAIASGWCAVSKGAVGRFDAGQSAIT